MMRQPIVTILAHVDHGKTTLLDALRKTAVAEREAGGITQAIGSTEVPRDVLEKICGPLLEKFHTTVDVPGLLFIDTPGHEAFTTLRRRGGSIADLVVLVVDIMEGIMPQTLESIELLRREKTPFIIAVNKIDRLQSWHSVEGSFLENYEKQSDHAKQLFEEHFYALMNQFSQHGFSCDRFDRVQDFRRNVCAVPMSGKTGEGLPELIAIIIGLAQQFLKQSLQTTDKSEGIVLEVKDVSGLGKTLDTVIYGGTVRKNDYLVIAGSTFIITKIKALLVPPSMKDLRTEKHFENVDECAAACGVKIVAPNIENVASGSSIRTAATYEEAQRLLQELEKERIEVEISHEGEGVILKADTIGGLEALEALFKNVSIKEARVGAVSREDVVRASVNKELKTVICFNMQPSEEVQAFAADMGVEILSSNIIYDLVERFEKALTLRRERERAQTLESVTRPGKLTILPGCVFRASNPAIVGCEVQGVVKPGFRLFVADQKSDVQRGEIKQIQVEGKNVSEAVSGDRVAVSLSSFVVGRHVRENSTLYTDVSSEEYKTLKKFSSLLSRDEINILEEIKELKQKTEKLYGLM